ncbi:two-component sensor histidine kinase BarA [Thalassotalea sp. PLHSN55]|uniref:two-component sensor histidine kinase BarA n=1 Tax=Thalassotalea sp. PLHSN55 TaxID=3435888 RepID=UPI003F850AB4
MQKISLKDWVILLTILPTTLIGIAIAGYFSYSRYVELNDYLDDRATSIIEPLAIASLDPLLNRDRANLRQLIGFTHRSQSSLVKSIAVFTKDNQVFVTSTYQGNINLLRIKAGDILPVQTQFEYRDDSLIYRAPIIDERISQQDGSNRSPQQSIVGYLAIQVDKSSINFTQQSQFIIAFAIVVFGSLISALFASRLIKNVTRPISSMVQSIDRIREGKLESRVTGQLIGELNFLKNGVNAMAQSLGDYHDEMQRSIDQATIDLRESLEQFEIQNVELDISKRKAQDANRVKSEFLANMSHELRTPLNGVIGFTRQLLKTPLTETQRDYLQTIERSGNNLLAIINDILDFSKLDAGKMVIESMPFSIRESIDEALTLLAPSAHKKNIELSLRINQQLPDSLIGDAMRVKQILTNLTNNAIKFTDKGHVNIDVDSEYHESGQLMVKITVQDSGIGMSKKQQETIFEAFGQADNSVTRLYGGTGLGLVISQRLAHEMKGDIGFTSEEKRGSSFWYSFVCEQNALPLISMQNYSDLFSKSILYFETHTHTRIATSEVLANWHMNVSPVGSLEQLSDILTQDNAYDYALLSHDVGPAELNDFKNLVATIKEKIPSVHVCINSTSPNLQEALIASGALSCISKPISAEKLNKALLGQQYSSANTLINVSEQIVPIKVLAVDDNEANLKLIKALLEEQVSDVTTAVNGEEAVRLCQNEKFALIYMDIQMPVMDGVTALEMIKSSTFNDQTPIIAVTAHALNSEKEKLLQQGFNSYMTKPIDETMLRHTIYEYCDLALFSSKTNLENKTLAQLNLETFAQSTIIDWPLALRRAGNKEALAKEMLIGLVKSLPESKQAIEEALACQDSQQLKTLIHKLNGACCYSGVPSLAKITQQLETALKKDDNLENLEPEFLEFFEQLENVINESQVTIDSLQQPLS